MFPLRCIFWLSIVYGSMTWHNGSLATADAVTATAAVHQLAAVAVSDGAAASLETYCRSRPAECLASAARLTKLLGEAAAEDPQPRLDRAATATIPVPTPVPDPRRYRGGKPAWRLATAH